MSAAAAAAASAATAALDERAVMAHACRAKFGQHVDVLFKSFETSVHLFSFAGDKTGVVAVVVNTHAVAARAAEAHEPAYVCLVKELFPSQPTTTTTTTTTTMAQTNTKKRARAVVDDDEDDDEDDDDDDAAAADDDSFFGIGRKKTKAGAAGGSAGADDDDDNVQKVAHSSSASSSASTESTESSAHIGNAASTVAAPAAAPVIDDDDAVSSSSSSSSSSNENSSGSAAAPIIVLDDDDDDQYEGAGGGADYDSTSSSDDDSSDAEDDDFYYHGPIPPQQLRVGQSYEMLRVGLRCAPPLRIDDETGTGVFVTVILKSINGDGRCTVYAPDVAYETKSRASAVITNVPWLYQCRKRSKAAIDADKYCVKFSFGDEVDTRWFVYEDQDRFTRWYPSRVIGRRCDTCKQESKVGGMLIEHVHGCNRDEIVYLVDVDSAKRAHIPPAYVREATDISFEPTDCRPLAHN